MVYKMSDRIVSFPNGVSKNFGVRSGLLSETNITENGFTVNFYVSNGSLFTFERADVSNDAFTIAAAAYGVEQRVKAATNMKQEERTEAKIAEAVEKTLTALSEGWTATRQAGVGSASKPSILEQAFLSIEGNTKETWDSMDVIAKRNVRKDKRVNKAFLLLQAQAIDLDEAA
jgi:flagellar biosynthesis GTPase FlhF